MTADSEWDVPHRPTKPADYDFDYVEWWEHEWPLRTWFGKSKMVAVMGVILLMMVLVTLAVAPFALAERLAPRTYKEEPDG